MRNSIDVITGNRYSHEGLDRVRNPPVEIPHSDSRLYGRRSPQWARPTANSYFTMTARSNVRYSVRVIIISRVAQLYWYFVLMRRVRPSARSRFSREKLPQLRATYTHSSRETGTQVHRHTAHSGENLVKCVREMTRASFEASVSDFTRIGSFALASLLSRAVIAEIKMQLTLL